MRPITHQLVIDNQSVLIHGFIAFLLEQGDEWDYRCVEADIRDYHQQQYARMNGIEALKQETDWWVDAYQTKSLHAHPQKEYLLSAGVYYLYDCARQFLTPDTDAEKLTTTMSVLLDEDRYLYKDKDTFAIFTYANGPDFTMLINGFPAQLLTYAACTTIDSMLEEPDIDDPLKWVVIMQEWLQSPAAIRMDHINFDIPNVYALYASYLEEEKRNWEASCQKYYHINTPQLRSFIASLRQRCQEESELAIQILSPYMSAKQQKAYGRYLSECQQYLADHSQTRSKGRSYSLASYWCTDIPDYIQQAAIRKLKDAVNQEHPAAALTLVVKQLQRDGILIKELRPLTHFIAAINKVFGSKVKYDTFSKHFR